MAYGSKDERKARMKAAVERQMREHPEWYDGSYNDSPTGGYTQKSVKAEAETAVKAAQQSEYRLKRLAEQRAAMEQRNAAGRAAATGALAGIAGRYTYDNAGKVRTVQPETLYSVSDKFPYSYHAAKQAKANGLTERDLQVRMKIAGELLEQAGVQQWAQKEKERLLKLDVAATEEKIAATQALLEKVDSDKNAMPVDEYENLERHVTATVARLRQDIRLHERYMTEQGYLQAPDFAFYSRMGAEMKNPTWEEANSGFSIGRWRPFAKEIANPVTFSQDKENLGKAALQQATPGGGDGLVNSSYQYMEKYETAIYNYILAKEGKEKAQDYLDLIQEGLNARSGAAMAEGMAGNRLEQLAFGAIAGLDQFASGIKQSLSKEALPATEIQYASGAVREDLGNWGLKLPDWLGGSTLGQVAYDAVTTGTNMAPSILLSQVTGYLGGASWLAKGAGSLSMGISSGGNAYNEMLKQGYDPDQARNYALLVGASESGLSYLLGGISKLGGKVTGQAAQTAIRNIDNAFVRIAVEGIINTTGEGVEEYLQEILEPAFRNLCFGEDNEIRLFTPEAAYSYLVGALTAGIMEGPSTIKKGLSASRRGKCVALAGKTNELIERAAQSPDRETANLALEMQQGRVRINNSNLGELLTAYDDAGGDLSFMKEFNAQASSDAKVASAQEAETDPLRQAAYQAAGGKAQAESAQTARETGRTPAGLGAEATFNESGARARVTGIASVEDGTVYVRLEDGSTAAADDLSFDDPALDRLYGEAGMLDAQGARSFIAGYDGTTAVPAYASGFMAAYGAARTGKSQDQARMASPYAAGLPAASFQYAYAAGENARSGAGQDAGAKTKSSIKELGDGRAYVEADRAVIRGKDPKRWAGQVTKFINEEIRHGRNVTVYGADGDPLTITRDTAGKAQFRNTVRELDGTVRPMFNDEYATKLRAEAHVDELAQVSRRGRRTVPDTKNHRFARDGFNYRTAYFKDASGYYRLTLSVGQNGTVNTIYNVGKIEEAAFPMSGRTEKSGKTEKGAQRPSGAKRAEKAQAPAATKPQERAASPDSVPQKGKAVNSSIRREGAKDVRPGLTRAYQVDKLTEAAKAALKKNRVQLKLIDYMARRYGVEVVLTDTLKGMTLGGTVIETDANGLYDPESGKIYLSVTAQGGAFAYVAMHEMAHYIRAWNREGYKALQRAVQEALEANGQDVEALARYQMEQFGYDEEAALEEVVANSLPAVLADEGFVRELTQTNRRLAMKVRDFLHDLVKNLKDALDKLAQSRSWKQMAALREDLDSLRDMERAFTAAMEGTQSAGGLAEAVSDARYSLNPDFARQYDNWDGKDPHTVFTIGTTSKALVSIGIKDSRILWDGSKIAKIKVKHPGMTDAIIKQVPNIIENPVLVMQSQQADSRIVMFGEVFDANNIPVLAVLELNPTLRGQYDMNIIKIASAYGKDTNPQRLINTSMILYVDPNKNRTDRWLKRTRLQLPFKLQHYGSIGSVTYPKDAVNASIRQNGGKDAKAGAAAAPSGAGNIESRGKQAAKQSAKDEAGYAYAKKNLATDESLYHYEFLIHLQDQQVTRLAEVSSLQDENGRLDTNAILKKAHENLAQEGQTDGTGKNWVTNAYTARPLRVDNSTIRHSLNGEHRRILTNARIAASIGTIIKNAVPINALHNAAEGVIGTYAMVSYANDSKGREFIAIITVEQRTGEINGLTTFDVAHSASGRQKKSSQADTKSQGVNPIKAATISIRKLLGIVNETYQSLLSENVLAALGQKRNPQGHYSNRVKFSQKDIENLREADVETLLENASNGAYHDGSYIPLRRNTPQALMEILGQHSGEAIEDLPVIMNVGKVRQAMEEGEYAGGRGHGISREGMMAIIKGMDDPAYIVEQENGRYVEVVRYYDGQKRAAWAVLDFGNFKRPQHMNGYEGGQYHVLVTAFEPDNLKRYLSHNVREILYDKRKDALQSGSGRLWPSHLNRTPFADSIPPEAGQSKKEPKFSQKDIENLREADVETLLENASNGAYHDGSYIPLRRNTPQALMEILGQHSGEAIEDLPVIMNVGKVRQAMEEGEYAGGRGHGISREGMMAIIKGMDDPAYIVEQENGRYVEVVRYYDGQKRAAWAVLDFGNLKNAEYMNGYEGGQYHVLVTAFEPDNLKRYLSGHGNKILYDKRKDALQRGSGRLWPSHLNRTPFADSIPSGQAQGKEKPKFSLKEGMTEGERYEALKDAELQVPRYDGEASKLTEAEAERLARSTRRDARRYVKTLYEKFGLGKQYVNRAADIEFEFSRRGFEESVNKQTARNADYASFGKMLASLDRIIENAIPLEIHGDKYRGTRREDPLLERVYVLVSAYEDGGIVPIQLEVKEYREQDNQLYVAVTLNKIEAGVFTAAQHFQHEAGVLSAAVPGFTLSLRELFANINPEDGEMLKYVPDGFLDGAQRAAKARALEREKAKLEGLKKLRFSLKDTAEVDTRALLAENERLRGALESLKAQFKLTGGHRIKPESVNRLAGRLLRQARSSYDRATLVENLTRMFDYLGNAENPAWEELAQMGTGLIRRVLERSSEIDQESYGLYAEPRAYLKETAIRLSESQREEAAAVAGSYRDYRVLVGRSVKLGNQGTSLDEAWQALSAMAPWLFDPEAAEGDQVAQLADIVEMMQPQYVNPYGYDIDEAAYDLFLWVYNQYFDLPEVRTYADRQAQKMTRLKGEFARRLQEGREAAKARLEAAQEAYRAERAEDDLLRRWLAAKDANEQKMRRDAAAERFRERLARKEGELLQARAKARARRQAMADTEVKQKLRKRIERTSRELSGWLLKPSEKQYVPDHLRRAVAGFLETIDLTGKEGADTKKAQKWRERMMDVTQAMRNIDAASGIAEQAAGYATAFIDFDEGDVARMEAFTTANQGTNTLMEMDAAQLKELDFLMRNIRRTITEANRNHANRRYATVEAAAQATMEQLDAKREKRALRGAAGMADRLLNLDQLDSFSFFRQLGPAAESVLEGLRRGFDQKVLRTREAMEYMKEAAEGAGLRKVSGLGAQTHTFQVTGGELTLTTAQIMELYLLNKREQARRHLYSGGIRPAETTVRAGRKTITLRKTAPVQVTEADVEQITAVLTPEQARLADRMQRFLSHQAAAWGNGASMELKGYKRFTEKDYYPIHSDGHYLLTQDPQRKEGLNAIRNYGWTKPAAQHAGNAIILGDVFDTFTRHVDEMATYSAFAAPLSDAMKWLNYRGLDQEGRPVSVKQSIARAYGQDAVRYIVKFLQDLNGISKAEDGPGLASLLLRNAKVAAVAANLRVVLQQPTAYLRAAAELDAQYLLKAAARKPAVAKAQQYAPIALWKSWGFFELDTGKSMRDIIVGSQSAKSRAQEKALWLAGKADDITWGALWNACELETLDKQPQLAPGSEAFNQAVGLRLSQVVDATQVVDSVFHRSQIMRSKNGLTGLYTSFMAEPTKSYNMLRNAIMDYREKPGKDSALRLARVGLTFAATAMATAASAALADAFRDDKEEDEDGRARGFGRKWLEAFAANAIDGLNPLNLIPGAKDVMSMLEGYDPSRMDLQALSKLMSAAEGLILYLRGESRYNAYKITYDITQALSSLTGLPVGNLMRTLNSLYNTVSPEGIDWYNETATPAIAYENLYQAILEQDEAKEARIRKKLAQDKDAPKAPADIDAGIAKVMMEYDSRVIRAYEAREATDTQNVRRLKREIMEDGFTGEMVDKAIGLYAASLKEPGEKELDKKLDAKLYSYEHLYRAIRAAADSGRYDSVADIRKELEADSEAGDPAAAVKSKVSSEMRKDYVAFVNAGKDQQADALAAVLKDQFGFEDSDLRRWVLDSRRDSTVQAIDAGDIAAANRYIDGQKELGREDKDIAQSLRSLYRDQIVQLYNEGKTEEMNNLVARLSRLKLYNQDGSRCFTAKKAQEWIDAAKKKARAQEQRK